MQRKTLIRSVTLTDVFLKRNQNPEKSGFFVIFIFVKKIDKKLTLWYYTKYKGLFYSEGNKMSRDNVHARLNKIKDSKEPLIERVAKSFAERHPDAARKFAKAAVVVATVATIAQGCAPRQNANKDDKVKSNVETVDEQIGSYIEKADHITYEAAQEMLARGVHDGHLKADTATYSALGVPDGWSVADAQAAYGDGMHIANVVSYEVNKDNPGKFENIENFTATAYNYVDENGKENGETSLIMSRSLEEGQSIALSYPGTPATTHYNGKNVEDRYYQSTTGEINPDYQMFYGDHTNCRVLYNQGNVDIALQAFDENNKPDELRLRKSGDYFQVIFGPNKGIDGKYSFYGHGDDASHVGTLTPIVHHAKIYGSTR